MVVEKDVELRKLFGDGGRPKAEAAMNFDFFPALIKPLNNAGPEGTSKGEAFEGARSEGCF